MQIMAGRMWSNGKMFSVAGKDSLASLAPAHADSPRRPARSYESAIEAHGIVFNPVRQDLYSAQVALRYVYRECRFVAAWIERGLARYV